MKVADLVRSGESRTVEFKSTGRLNLYTVKKDEAIEWAVIKTIAGFLNASGGTLLVGVNDDGTPVGIEHDYPTLRSPSQDRWELWLMDLVRTSLGGDVAAKLTVTYELLNEETIARIDVAASTRPVYAKRKGERRGVFYVRQGPSTGELEGAELPRYLADQFESGRASSGDPVRSWKRVAGFAALGVLAVLGVVGLGYIFAYGPEGSDLPGAGDPFERTVSQDGGLESGRAIRVADVDSYRRRFGAARSGNGWTRLVTVNEWQVTLWVGDRGGEPVAVVFPPRRRQRNGTWIESERGPLMEGTQLDEAAAFAWLMELEESGRVQRESLRSINAFQRSVDSVDSGVGGSSALDEGSQAAIRGGSESSITGAVPHGDSPEAQGAEVALYRSEFDAARSGNGWTRSLDIRDGWRVTLWVGTRRGRPAAAVFAPRKREGSRWVETQSGALMEATHADHDAAFAWLLQLETTGDMREGALRSIADFARAPD